MLCWPLECSLRCYPLHLGICLTEEQMNEWGYCASDFLFSYLKINPSRALRCFCIIVSVTLCTHSLDLNKGHMAVIESVLLFLSGWRARNRISKIVTEFGNNECQVSHQQRDLYPTQREDVGSRAGEEEDEEEDSLPGYRWSGRLHDFHLPIR